VNQDASAKPISSSEQKKLDEKENKTLHSKTKQIIGKAALGGAACVTIAVAVGVSLSGGIIIGAGVVAGVIISGKKK
jgi:hypothetical protein